MQINTTGSHEQKSPFRVLLGQKCTTTFAVKNEKNSFPSSKKSEIIDKREVCSTDKRASSLHQHNAMNKLQDSYTAM